MAQKYQRIVVKVGSNVLTRSDGTLDVTRLSALVDQIAALRRAGIEVILISSGAVACGRSVLRNRLTEHSGKLDAVDERQLFSAVGQAKLINRYYDLFHEHGITVGQVLTMKECFASRSLYLNQRNCMQVMLEQGVLPIVNENDTVSVTELMFTDNDELSGLIASMMDVQALIILTNVDGIFTGVPGTPYARLIPVVQPDDDLSRYISTVRSGFGRGGMMTKSSIARKVAAEGTEVIIANGKREQVLLQLLLPGSNPNSDDCPCTRFIPGVGSVSSVKKWIAHSGGFVKGALQLRAETVQVLNGPKAVSLLPVGITSVTGDFEKDDLVKLVSPSGDVVGLGRTAYSADEIRALLGQHGCKPVVHYDYLYLEEYYDIGTYSK